MSNLSTLALTLLYLLPVALMAVLLTRTRLPRWVLTTVLVMLPAFYIGHYLLMQQIQGWPIGEPIPDQFRLLAFDIVQPDPKTNHPGQIVLWLKTAESAQPRAHRLPYRKDLHQNLVSAGQRQTLGIPQVCERSQSPATGTPDNSRGERGSIRFKDEPHRPPPPKGSNS